MENKFYKVFCGALVFGIVAMILLAVVLCCGHDNGWLSIFVCCVLFSIVLLSIILCRYSKIIDREYDDVIKEKDEEINKLEEKIKKLPQPDKEIVKCDMVKHQERMALIKQLGKDAPNDVIVKLLEK